MKHCLLVPGRNLSTTAIMEIIPSRWPRPIWRAPWKNYRVISGHLGWVRSVAVDPSNTWFCTGSVDRTIKIWNLASGRLKLTLTGHIDQVRGLADNSKHTYMFSTGDDKLVKCWDLEQNKGFGPADFLMFLNILYTKCFGGGLGGNQGLPDENGTVSGKSCPKGLYGTLCVECPAGTYKNATGSDRSLCFSCPGSQLPNRGVYMPVRGGATKIPFPRKCVSGRYHMPHCYTALEQLVYKFGGPWLFGLLLLSLLILLALVLSVSRTKFIGVDESPGAVLKKSSSQTDHAVTLFTLSSGHSFLSWSSERCLLLGSPSKN